MRVTDALADKVSGVLNLAKTVRPGPRCQKKGIAWPKDSTLASGGK